MLAALSGNCTVPIAAYAVDEREELWVRAVLGGPDVEGSVALVRAEARGPVSDPERVGREVADGLLARGGARLLEAAWSGSPGLPAPKRA